MRITLRHNMTGCFVKKDHGEWTFNKEECRVFPTVMEARKHCHRHGLKNMHALVEDQAGGEPAVIFVRVPAKPRSVPMGLPLEMLQKRTDALRRTGLRH